MVQLERLQYLISTRVHLADVLVGESRWLEGCWIIQGDALIGVDMSKAEIKDRDEKARHRGHRPAPADSILTAREPREEPAMGHQVSELDPHGEHAPGRQSHHGERSDARGTASH